MVLSAFSNPKPKNWSLKTYLKDNHKRIEQLLAQLPFQPGKPTRALEALKYALQTPGKRFRPLLTIAAADIYKAGQREEVLHAAVAIELIHTASLLFDDLPCMDDASLRRGKETAHRIYGEDQAILAAMALIAQANSLLTGPSGMKKKAAPRQLECLQILNHSYSLEGLCGGQSDDLLDRKDMTLKDLEFIHAKKTGALFTASTDIGAVLGGATARERKWLLDFAKNLGLAFQIKDDMLDFESSNKTGKDANKDKNKTTFVSLGGMAASKKLYGDLMDVAMSNLEPFGEDAFHLRALTQVIRDRDF